MYYIRPTKRLTNESECYNNIHILNDIIRHSKVNKKELVAAQLDISKAFDTVPHSATGPALRRRIVQRCEYSYQSMWGINPDRASERS